MVEWQSKLSSLIKQTELNLSLTDNEFTSKNKENNGLQESYSTNIFQRSNSPRPSLSSRPPSQSQFSEPSLARNTILGDYGKKSREPMRYEPLSHESLRSEALRHEPVRQDSPLWYDSLRHDSVRQDTQHDVLRHSSLRHESIGLENGSLYSQSQNGLSFSLPIKSIEVQSISEERVKRMELELHSLKFQFGTFQEQTQKFINMYQEIVANQKIDIEALKRELTFKRSQEDEVIRIRNTFMNEIREECAHIKGRLQQAEAGLHGSSEALTMHVGPLRSRLEQLNAAFHSSIGSIRQEMGLIRSSVDGYTTFSAQVNHILPGISDIHTEVGALRGFIKEHASLLGSVRSDLEVVSSRLDRLAHSSHMASNRTHNDIARVRDYVDSVTFSNATPISPSPSPSPTPTSNNSQSAIASNISAPAINFSAPQSSAQSQIKLPSSSPSMLVQAITPMMPQMTTQGATHSSINIASPSNQVPLKSPPVQSYENNSDSRKATASVKRAPSTQTLVANNSSIT